jgi:uncharacterized protein (TIGR03435 family)
MTGRGRAPGHAVGRRIVLLACAALVFGQAPPRFDVASVKVLAEGSRVQVVPSRSGGRLTWPANLLFLVTVAYEVPDWRIAGLPEASGAYQIDAATSPQATDHDVYLMFQTLLAGRFHMVSHWVTREMDGYALTVAKGGPKILEAQDGLPPGSAPPMFRKYSAEQLKEVDGLLMFDIPKPGVVSMAGRRVGIARVAEALDRFLQAPVADQTGLAGKYYFACEFARPGGPEDADAESLRAAMQSLGLRLEKRKTMVEVLVVDSIATTPTEN